MTDTYPPLLTDEEIHEYTELVEVEDDLKWQQGEWLDTKLQTVLPRFEEKKRSSIRKQFFEIIAQNNRQSVDTIRLRYRTVRAFPDGSRALDKSWTFHMMCAKTDNPQAWMERALHEGWGQTELETAIKASGGKLQEELIHHLRGAPLLCVRTVQDLVTFQLPEGVHLKKDVVYHVTVIERPVVAFMPQNEGQKEAVI